MTQTMGGYRTIKTGFQAKEDNAAMSLQRHTAAVRSLLQNTPGSVHTLALVDLFCNGPVFNYMLHNGTSSSTLGLLDEIANTGAKHVTISDVGSPRRPSSMFSNFRMLSTLNIQNFHFESLFLLPLHIQACSPFLANLCIKLIPCHASEDIRQFISNVAKLKRLQCLSLACLAVSPLNTSNLACCVMHNLKIFEIKNTPVFPEVVEEMLQQAARACPPVHIRLLDCVDYKPVVNLVE
jgi:hypothetical protein